MSVTANCIIRWGDMSAGTFNSANAPAGTFGTYDSWSGGSVSRFTISVASLGVAWPNPIVVSGNTYATLSASVLLNDTDSGAGIQNIYFYFPGNTSPTVNEVILAGFVKYNVSNPTGNDVSLDTMYLYPVSGGDWSVTQLTCNPNDGSIALRAHAQISGGSTFGSEITITKNKTYFVTHFRDMSAQQAIVKVYDPDNAFALVGTSTAACGNANVYTMILTSGYFGDPTGDIAFGDITLIYEPTAQQLINLVTPQSTAVINVTNMSFGALVIG